MFAVEHMYTPGTLTHLYQRCTCSYIRQQEDNVNWLIVGTESFPGAIDLTGSVDIELDEKTMLGLKSTYRYRYNIENNQTVTLHNGNTVHVPSDEFVISPHSITNKVTKFFKVS
jgi:hypothetical protein